MGEHSRHDQASKKPTFRDVKTASRGGQHDLNAAATDRLHSGAPVPCKSTNTKALYTPAQRQRRDASIWTPVQGVLAPLQFLIFLVSLFLVARYLTTGQGYDAAVLSILIKTLALYTIMVTGALWEKEVFGQYLLAPAFFWEDVFSFLVIALHTAYLGALIFGIGTPVQQMTVALLAYGTYVINAAQFIWKLRQARLETARLETRARPESSAPTLSATSFTAPFQQGARS
ncbi:MAG: 2-vinyl bacteriochlorophyllide hydratase [Pseudomonadota bacterium]